MVQHKHFSDMINIFIQKTEYSYISMECNSDIITGWKAKMCQILTILAYNLLMLSILLFGYGLKIFTKLGTVLEASLSTNHSTETLKLFNHFHILQNENTIKYSSWYATFSFHESHFL